MAVQHCLMQYVRVVTVQHGCLLPSVDQAHNLPSLTSLYSGVDVFHALLRAGLSIGDREFNFGILDLNYII